MTETTYAPAPASTPPATSDDDDDDDDDDVVVVDATTVDTLIVGAGLSGAVALYELARSTMQPQQPLLLLEARPDRCGGRSCTESIRLDTEPFNRRKKNDDDDNDNDENDDSHKIAKNVAVDTGGQWLGRCQTKMMEIVQILGLEVEAQSFPPPPSSSSSSSSSLQRRAKSQEIAQITTSSSSIPDLQARALIELAYYPLTPLSTEAQEEIRKFEQYLQICYQTIERRSEVNIDEEDKNNFPQSRTWDQKSIGQVIDERCTLSSSREQWYYLVQTVLAVDAHDCSFLFFLHYVYNNTTCDDSNDDEDDDGQLTGMELLGDGPEGLQALKVKGGIQQISELLIDKAGQYQQQKQQQNLYAESTITQTAPIIRYGCEVVRIDYTRLTTSSVSDDNHTVDHRRVPHDKVRVETADGSIFDCRSVILALAPTLIRDIIFDPPLEASRTQLYNHMIRGSAVKVILVFEAAFWRHINYRNDNHENRKSISEVGPVSNIFESTVGEYPALIGLLTGRHAEQYHAIPDTGTRREMIMTQIHDMYCREQNNNNSLPQTLAFLSKDWLDEPYSGGCFASIVPPSSDAIFARCSQLLREPIVPHRLVVAATESSTQFYGYLEGAARAGARAAEEVLSAS